jgi:pimeloyl-ACP methyl ester carboxylesterase
MSAAVPIDSAVPCRTEFRRVRGLNYHLRRWGDPAAPMLLLLHGWLDVSETFGPLVAQLAGRLQVVAPDWRGFGHSDWQPDGYWFMDYVADLDELGVQLSPDAPMWLAGHSMGAQVAAHYAGLRPERVSRLACLDGLLIPDSPIEGVVARQRQWLDQLRDLPVHKVFADVAELSLRVRRLHPRLSEADARFVAACWSRPVDGGVQFSFDPRHRLIFPVGYRLAESMAVWREVQAECLFVDGALSELRRFVGEEEMARRRACFARRQETLIATAGHMLHFDAPEQTAEALDRFFR